MIKVIKLVQTCYACPSQWEGITDTGESIYVRYRWGHLSINKAKDHDSHFRDKDYPNVLYLENIPKMNMDGFMEFETLKELTKDIIEWDCTPESEDPPF